MRRLIDEDERQAPSEGGVPVLKTGLLKRETNEEDDPTLRLPDDFGPSSSDVIIGWARQHYHHAGNVMLRKLVRRYVPEYDRARTKSSKGELITKLLHIIRKRSPTGTGFVRRSIKTGRWYYIGNGKAKDKIGHALRKAIMERRKKRDKYTSRKADASDRNSKRKRNKLQQTSPQLCPFEDSTTEKAISNLPATPHIQPNFHDLTDTECEHGNLTSLLNATHVLRNDVEMANDGEDQSFSSELIYIESPSSVSDSLLPSGPVREISISSTSLPLSPVSEESVDIDSSSLAPLISREEETSERQSDDDLHDNDELNAVGLNLPPPVFKRPSSPKTFENLREHQGLYFCSDEDKGENCGKRCSIDTCEVISDTMVSPTRAQRHLLVLESPTTLVAGSPSHKDTKHEKSESVEENEELDDISNNIFDEVDPLDLETILIKAPSTAPPLQSTSAETQTVEDDLGIGPLPEVTSKKKMTPPMNNGFPHRDWDQAHLIQFQQQQLRRQQAELNFYRQQVFKNEAFRSVYQRNLYLSMRRQMHLQLKLQVEHEMRFHYAKRQRLKRFSLQTMPPSAITSNIING